MSNMLSNGSDGSLASDHEEDEDERRHRNRERNKEHARKTRVRKKEQLQGLKTRVNELEEEGRRLKQSIQECSVASILLGLSAGPAAGSGAGEKEGTLSSAPSSPRSNFGACLAGDKRKRFLSLDGEDPTPPPMELNIKGQIALVGGPCNEGKTQINWKTGVYFDEKGKRQQLTKIELESLRRERNRMHAKMTRDRKKCFIASLKRVISRLEDENQQLRETLKRSRADEISQAQGREQKETGHVFPGLSSGITMQQSKASSSVFNSHMFTFG